MKEQGTEEISILSFSSAFVSSFKENKKYLIIPFLLGIIFATIFFYHSYRTKPTFNADLTYMVNEDEGSKLGSNLLSALGKFGVGGTTKFNLEKILFLSKSEFILRNAIFQKATIDGKIDFYANHIIRLYDLKKENELNVTFKDSVFDNFTLDERKMLKIITDVLVGKKGIITTEADEKTGIMTQSVNSLSEEFSIKLSQVLFDQLSIFYIEKSVGKEKHTYDIVKKQVDSLYRIINTKDLAKANISDQTLGVWQDISKVPSKRLDRDININTIIYGEALKNLGIADITLKTKTPYIQYIDIPYGPIKPIKPNKVIALLIGFSIGTLIGFIFIFFFVKRK